VVVIDPGESGDKVRRFADQYGWDFDVLLDTDHRVSRRYGVNSHPRNYIIDRQGNLIGLAIGYRDWSSKLASQIVEGLLANGSWQYRKDRSE